MNKQKHYSQQAPKAIGPYSQAIQSGNTIYLSGQIPLNPDTMTLVGLDFADQARQVFNNMQAVCKVANGSMNHLVKLTIYLTDLADFSVLNEVMLEFFSEPYPARTTIQVSALPKAAKIEVDGIMVI